MIYNQIATLRDLLFSAINLANETDSSTFKINMKLLSEMSRQTVSFIEGIKNRIKDDAAIRLLDKVSRNIKMMDHIYFSRYVIDHPDEMTVKRFKLVIGKWTLYYCERVRELADKYRPETKVDRINPKVCLCCIAKNENKYIRDYVDYYMKLGFSHISIIDNNDKDGEKFEDVINDYIESGYVSIINARGFKRHQCTAYKVFYDRNHNEYDYIAYFDCDEYLVLKEDKSIQEYLRRSIFDDAQVIQLSWLMFGDSGHITYEDRPMYERFTDPIHSKGNLEHVKSIIRCDIDPDYIRFRNPHTVSCMDLYFVNGEGERIINSFQQIPSYKLAQLNHYYTKSLEEFLWRYERGRADIIDRRTIEDFARDYFALNEKTIDKEKFVEDFKKKFEK